MGSEQPQDPLSRFVSLADRRREIEDELQEIKKEVAALEMVLLDSWADIGQQSARINSTTVYVQRRFYCSKKGGTDTQEVCRALECFGLGDMVAPAYQPASLTAKMKELAAAESIPEELERLLNYGEQLSLRCRRA